jgi:hypothetical protein
VPPSRDEPAGSRSVVIVYDHDPDDVIVLGWEAFVLQLWESIFLGYRSWAGLRTLGRRWSDLIEAGLGCSQDVADTLVKAIVIDGPDRRVEGETDAMVIVTGMIDVLDDIPRVLTSGQDLDPPVLTTLLARHARLVDFISAQVFAGWE